MSNHCHYICIFLVKGQLLSLIVALSHSMDANDITILVMN